MTERAERPILFSAPMIAALLRGSKTQTRRIVKFPKKMDARDYDEAISAMNRAENKVIGERGPCDGLGSRWACPYGKPGEHLWVKETWSLPSLFDKTKPSDACLDPRAAGCVRYLADGKRSGKIRPSIFMPRWASRLLLEIVSVRCERVQDITESDAIAEGVAPLFDAETARTLPECDFNPMPHKNYLWHGEIGRTITRKQSEAWPYQYSSYKSAQDSYSSLYESINGKGAWDRNDWVWVIEFRRVIEKED